MRFIVLFSSSVFLSGRKPVLRSDTVRRRGGMCSHVTCIIFLYSKFTFNGVLFYFRQKFILACPTTFVGLRILRFYSKPSFASHGATFCLRSYRRHYEVSLSFV